MHRPSGPSPSDEHDYSGPRAPSAAHAAAVQGGRHRTRPLPRHRGKSPAHPGLRGRRDPPPGRGCSRDLHGPQELVRGRSRADISAALTQDRQDRSHCAGRRQPREALLPPRQGRPEGPDPRAAANLRASSRMCGEGGAAVGGRYPRLVAKLTGRKLLAFDRRLGGRFVAGADEAGRGPLAGPLVVAGVLLDLDAIREHRARPLALLNDSKQLDAEARDQLFVAVLGCAERVSVHVFPPSVIDRDGLHRTNLRGLRAALAACQPADVNVVDGFKLGPTAPPHRAVVDGDEKSAAIAAASIVAKVTRDRYMHTADALYPAYGFSSHVGY